MESQPAAVARIHLSDMLGQLENYSAAVETLKPLNDRLEKDIKFVRRVNIDYNVTKSDEEFYAGQDLVRSGELDRARRLLASAYQRHPQNIDILIAMYRLEGDDDWQQFVQANLQKAIRVAEAEVTAAERQVRRAPRLRDVHEDYASKLNQYAWLVSNTEGDRRRALEASLKSLEVEEDAAKDGHLRPLLFRPRAVGGRGFGCSGRAIRLMPHSPPLQRQLREFESKLAAASENSEPASD